jgi:hypothetical protein
MKHFLNAPPSVVSNSLREMLIPTFPPVIENPLPNKLPHHLAQQNQNNYNQCSNTGYKSRQSPRKLTLAQLDYIHPKYPLITISLGNSEEDVTVKRLNGRNIEAKMARYSILLFVRRPHPASFIEM